MDNAHKNLILIVDDNPYNIQVVAAALLEYGYELGIAMDGTQAYRFLEENIPELILLDIEMPDFDGYEVCRTIKNNPKFQDVPIIFLTAKNSSEDIVRGFNEGGVDYITKPFNLSELKARLKTHIELKKAREEIRNYVQRLEELNKELSDKSVQMNKAVDDLRFFAMTDPLTELANRRCITEKIEDEIRRFNRNKNPFFVILGDIDNFKKINDQYGHECGDYILKSLSRFMKTIIRERDILSRWGGEEFLLLITDTDLEGSLVVAEKLRSGIEALEIFYNEKRIRVTISFGVAGFNQEDGMDGTIKRADDALYMGKNNGKNCVVTL
jgi:diguanylate cyclase (GGDEF)-like protein